MPRTRSFATDDGGGHPERDGAAFRRILLPARAGRRRGGPAQGDVKTGDLAAISATRLLVAERDSQNGGPFRRRSHLDLAGATNVLGRDDFGGRTPEQPSDADPAAAGVAPARKTFVPASARTAGPSPAGCPRSCT